MLWEERNKKLNNVVCLGIFILAAIAFQSSMLSMNELRGKGFGPGTLVRTEKGSVAIEKLKAGDRAISFDFEHGITVSDKIIETYKGVPESVAQLMLKNQILHVGPEHQFYSAKLKTWVKVKELEKGDSLKIISGSIPVSDKTFLYRLKRDKAMLYCLTMKNNPNFFVTKDEILVHNMGLAQALRKVYEIGNAVYALYSILPDPQTIQIQEEVAQQDRLRPFSKTDDNENIPQTASIAQSIELPDPIRHHYTPSRTDDIAQRYGIDNNDYGFPDSNPYYYSPPQPAQMHKTGYDLTKDKGVTFCPFKAPEFLKEEQREQERVTREYYQRLQQAEQIRKDKEKARQVESTQQRVLAQKEEAQRLEKTYELISTLQPATAATPQEKAIEQKKIHEKNVPRKVTVVETHHRWLPRFLSGERWPAFSPIPVSIEEYTQSGGNARIATRINGDGMIETTTDIYILPEGSCLKPLIDEIAGKKKSEGAVHAVNSNDSNRAKNKGNIIPRGNQLAPFPDDDKDYDKCKHPHGRYEDAPYHHRGSKGGTSGGKSPAPKNGQKALDSSVPFKENSPNRVGVSEGEFVVLSRTSEQLYHGHVRTWSELIPEMRNALREAGLVNKAGKIIAGSAAVTIVTNVNSHEGIELSTPQPDSFVTADKDQTSKNPKSTKFDWSETGHYDRPPSHWDEQKSARVVKTHKPLSEEQRNIITNVGNIVQKKREERQTSSASSIPAKNESTSTVIDANKTSFRDEPVSFKDLPKKEQDELAADFYEITKTSPPPNKPAPRNQSSTSTRSTRNISKNLSHEQKNVIADIGKALEKQRKKK